ncbi:hypothetical protein HG531_005779 [Fusarium graminearum]|nr:hypothetical protein HG531_005779 [Fusarium graminearum]
MSHQIVVTSTISDAILLCANAFSDVLLRAASGQKVPDLAMLKEHHARFSIWAEDLRVSPESNSSPEDHLHHAPDAKNVIGKLLQQLKTNLEAILPHNPDSQIPEKPEETNGEDEYSSDSSLGIHEDDDMEGELELATEGHFATNKHTQFTGEIISHLYRFTTIVKEQHIDVEDQSINQWVLGEGQKLEHQLEGLELYISYSLDSDFPTLQPFLRDRLINTVIQRRKRLLYRQDCSVKSYSCMRCSSNSKNQELASGHQDVPDIRPYICLFENCNTPLRQFTTKNDWINHMSSQHAQVWVCQVKGHETYLFRNPADLEAHLQGQHADIICTDQVSFLAKKSARASSDILGALATENMSENSEKLPACPFCNLSASVFEPKSQLTAPAHFPTAEDSKETHRKVHDHISEHLKLIAHESIPPALQTPRAISLRNFKFAIICVSYLTASAVYGLFSEDSNMDHLFQKRIDDMNSYSLAAIGRHNVVLVRMSTMGNVDIETLFSNIRTSFPCIELFILADAYRIVPPSWNVEISFGDVIVGDRLEQASLIRQQRSDISDSNHKPGARVRSLLAKMRMPQVRKMVQHRMSTNLEVLSKYQSLAATYRSTEHSKGVIQIPHRREDHTNVFSTYKSERQSNGAPEPHFHFDSVDNPLSVRVVESDDIDFDKDQRGESFESLPCLLIESTCNYIANRQKTDERNAYAAATAAAFVSAILDLWNYMPPTEIPAIYAPVHHIPIPKNEDFVERKPSMKALQDKLFRDDTEQVTIYGSDGSGKTQLALWLAYWVKDNLTNYSVFWASAMSNDAFEQDCHKIVESLGYRCTSGHDPRVVLQSYLNSYRSGRWILILDEASDEDLTYGHCAPFLMSKFLPNSRKGQILVTTESTKVARVGDAIVTLSYMTLDESFNLLSRSLVTKSHDQDLVRELSMFIPHQPLDISLAAAYINVNKAPISSYLELLKGSFLGILDTQLKLCSPFEVSFEYIVKNHVVGARVLLFLSFFKRNTIHTLILPGVDDAIEFKVAMQSLYKYGFLAKKHDGGILDIHSHIHRATQLWIQKRQVAVSFRGSVAHYLAKLLATDILGTLLSREQFLMDILQLLAGAEHFHRGICDLGYQVGLYLHQKGRVEEAIELFERLLGSQKDALSEDEAYYLTLEFELAGLYRSNAQTQKAIDLLEHVVTTRDRTLEESNPDRLASQTELAGVYQKNGQHEQATKILEHLAAVRKRIDSEDSPDLLELQHQLANAYLSTDRLDEGNELLEHVNAVKGRSSWDAHSEQDWFY